MIEKQKGKNSEGQGGAEGVGGQEREGGARGREGTCRTLRRGWVCLIDLGVKARNLTRERKRNNLVERRKSFKFMVFFQICYNLTSLINYSGLLDILL